MRANLLVMFLLLCQAPTQIDLSRVKNAVTQTSQLLDWQMTRVSDTQIQFGAHCLPETPCNVAIGGVVEQFTNGPYAVNLNRTTNAGSVWICISNTGMLTAAVSDPLKVTDLSVSAGIVAGVTSLGVCVGDNYSIGRWDAAAQNQQPYASWAPTGSSYAAYASFAPAPTEGTGIMITGGPRPQIGIDPYLVERKFDCTGGPGAQPSGATRGDLCWDFSANPPAKYVCANAAGCGAGQDWRAF